MDLKSHLELIGHDADSFALKAKLPKDVIRNALSGKPVSLAHAQKIALQLSREHNLHSKNGFEHGDIDNLQVIGPDELKA
jgi:hypothetical protein